MQFSEAAKGTSVWNDYLEDISHGLHDERLLEAPVSETDLSVPTPWQGASWKASDNIVNATWIDEAGLSRPSVGKSLAWRKAHTLYAHVRANREEKGPSSQFVALQEWEGYVEKIVEGNDTFTARLTDKTNPDDSFEVGEFDLTDVASDDYELVRVGGVFRWVLGYRTFSTGRTEKSSSLIFRRLPAWRKATLARNKIEARELANSIRWE
ncbi:hypothetical protein [Devosia psychrophila]|uniref:Uncharacterized protein n=1 Tax=Devosia psychrophila TaxID=728005 RepID=A0A0F5PVM3_9HYPH|nr:hypothetical protein [Devosia psychrophila]KKC32645.1 hypothetical protein WH91_12495 [Devosia psychrophila]SFC50964.1 hypothetical protein SAMN04488059_10655 [Devosia psychrophila]